MNYRVEQKATDELSCRYWEFSTHTFPHLFLVRYGESERKTKRHKWVVHKIWDTYNHRSNTAQKPESIPDWVIDEARSLLYRSISQANVYIGAGAQESNIFKKGE